MDNKKFFLENLEKGLKLSVQDYLNIEVDDDSESDAEAYSESNSESECQAE